jgi:hypothetical protein
MSEQRYSRAPIFILLGLLLLAGGVITTLLYYYSKTLNAYRLLAEKYTLLAKGASENVNLILPTWTTLTENLSPNLLASIIGTFFAVFFGTFILRKLLKEKDEWEFIEKLKNKLPEAKNIIEAPDLSKMENLLEDTVGKWRAWNPEGVCSREAIGCPSELKEIYTKYDLISGVTRVDIKRANQLLLARLRYFNDQISNVQNGQWQLMIHNGDVLTDADLTYKIISEEILQREADIVIKASTIFPYIEWWLTSFGLKYLQSQREFKVQRVFLFPDGVYTVVFKDLNLESLINYIDAKKQLGDEYLTYSLREKLIRIIFYIHYCLKIDVLILSPSMLKDKQFSAAEKNVIEQWKNKDTVIIQKNSAHESINICSIQIEAFSGAAGQYLFADKGTVFFNNDNINNFLDSYEIISKHAIKFADILNKTEFNKTFKSELETTANVLGKGYNISKNTFDEAYDLTKIEQNIHSLAYQ